ncbi:MAG: peptidase M14 [Clostridia bacterium]|nr:peptidase M14 [Clostridia bacterium]
MANKQQISTKINHKNELTEFNSPIDYRSLMTTLQYFSEKYPFIGITYMGTSVLGRGIPMVTLGEGEYKKRSVLYVGCHHGMEWITSAVLLRFIEEYCMAYEGGLNLCNVNVRKLFKSRCIYVIPQFNVDGADIQINGVDGCILQDRLIAMNCGDDFSDWQANARGVDLNHNYDAGFGYYKQLEAESGIFGGGKTKYSGEAPESEPEVAAMCSFLRYASEIGTVLTLHSQGEEIYVGPKGVYVPRSGSIGTLISRMTGYRLSSPSGGAAYGGLTDWVTSELRRPSFTIECGKGENPLPIEDVKPIYSRLREAFFSVPLLI